MKTDTTGAPRTGRIAGPLHRRGNVQPASLEDEDLPVENAEVSDVAGQQKNNGHKDHKGAR